MRRERRYQAYEVRVPVRSIQVFIVEARTQSEALQLAPRKVEQQREWVEGCELIWDRARARLAPEPVIPPRKRGAQMRLDPEEARNRLTRIAHELRQLIIALEDHPPAMQEPSLIATLAGRLDVAHAALLHTESWFTYEAKLSEPEEPEEPQQ